MHLENTTVGPLKPGGEELPRTDVFADESEPHEWPGRDAATVFDGNGYEKFLPKSCRRDTGQTTLLELSYMFDDDEGREFREGRRQRQREAFACFRIRQSQCAASQPMRCAVRQIAHRGAAKRVTTAGDDSDPDSTPPSWSDLQVSKGVCHVG